MKIILLPIFCATSIFFNGVVNLFFGELFSEAIVILSSALFILSLERFCINDNIIISSLALCIFSVLNIFHAVLYEQYYRILFLYPYFLLLLIIPLTLGGAKLINQTRFSKIIRIFTYCACVSSVFAVLQRVGFSPILGLETELRAVGLSRTSLNLSGCLLAAFSCAVFNLNITYEKMFVSLVIFFGILAAGGRGAIISSLILVVIYVTINFSWKKFQLIAWFIPLIILAVSNFKDWFIRAFSAFDFKNDASNLERLDSYASFIDQFNFFGAWIGSTSPAVGRFAEFTGFESFFLNSLFDIGIPFAIILLVGFIFWLYKSYKYLNINYYIYLLALSPMLFGQQAHSTPSVLSATLVVLSIILINNFIIKNK